MRRGAKSAKSKVEAKPPIVRKSRKSEAARFHDLEKRLAEALQREAEASTRVAKAVGQLQTRDRELAEAQEQQTATSEILRVISSSPTDYHPVFNTIVRRAGVVCGAVDAMLWTVDGDELVVRAHHGPIAAAIGARQPIHGSVAGYAVREARIVHVEDLTEADDFPVGKDIARRLGWRTTLSAPLLREGGAIGAILIRRSEVRPFTDKQIALLKTFADQAVIAIENVRLFTELQEKNRALTQAHAQVSESLEQQTATSEILRVISSSPTDGQPVFDVIVESACRLCDAVFANAVQFDGELMHNMAHYGFSPEGRDILMRAFPRAPTRESMSGWAILDGAVVQSEDMSTDEGTALSHQLSRVLGSHAYLSVPMLREGVPVGAITVARRERGSFPARHVELLKTFADQAVIAIENVRLFTELQEKNQALTTAHAQVTEALEQQTATSEILRVISTSPTDLQPVLDAVVRSAARFCGADDAELYRLDEGSLKVVAHHGPIPAPMGRLVPVVRGTVAGRAVLERRAVHVADLHAEAEGFPVGNALAREFGFRTGLAVPLLREGTALGTINLRRTVVNPFSDKQVALLETFANQAVIAIENVRLFKELEARNHDLTRALDTQTATSDILRVISRSQTDVQPVFDAILASAIRLLGADTGVLTRVAGDQIELAALMSIDAAGDAALRATFPRPLQSETPHARVIRERAPLNIADSQRDPRLPEAVHAASRVRGIRSQVVVPLLRHEEAIGAIGVSRREAGGFTDDEVALLKTFADQAVIAIENVRLFKELEAKNRDLTEALEQQTATSEILRVISSSPTDEQPVFDAIVRSARQLCDAAFSVVVLTDTGRQTLAAVDGLDSARVAAMREVYPRPIARDTTSGRAILDRRVIHVEDSHFDPEYTHPLRDTVELRSILTVPIFREGLAVGAVSVWRGKLRPFTEKQITLLQTFADQAVIAIENVRLFKELEGRNSELKVALEQQTATSELLKVIGQSTFDLQPVFEMLAENAVRLCEAERAFVHRFDGQFLRIVATHNVSPELKAFVERNPIPPGRDSAAARAALEHRTVHIHDVQADDEVTYGGRYIGPPIRTMLAIPMLRAGELLGVIMIYRLEVLPFSDGQIALMGTFADQAAIAIENARLFKELQTSNHELTESLAQQTATAEILRVISQSPTDTQPVFDAIVRSGRHLCEARFSSLILIDGDHLALAATIGLEAEAEAQLRRSYPRPLARDTATGRAVLERQVVHVADLQAEADEFPGGSAAARSLGHRTILSVPLLREGVAIGAIALRRTEVQPFTDRQIALVTTFADQAVIAIENVRLFNELQARTQELTRSVDELTALGDVSRALSSTLDLETVLQTIVTRANQIAGTAGCTIWEYDEPREDFRLRASHYADEADAAVLQALGRVTTLRRGQGVTTQVMERRRPVQIYDIAVEGAYESPIRRPLIEAGHRALLGVPLLIEDQVIGVLAVTRKSPGAFEPETVQLLTTFATQSALAIQNARLFREIEDKSRQLEVASQHKSEFLANMSHELRTPLNAVIGFSEVLTERMFGELNDKQDEYVKDIYASGTHLLSLINDILDLSKIEAGRMELELADFDLPQAIENALVLVRERALRRGITLEQSIDPRLGEIQGDERKIKQVLLNLLSNAIKFTPEGGRVGVRAAVVDGRVEVAVSDTGIGIAPEDQEAVFEEFRQVGAAEKRAEGTGLGLALARKFIELHGGRIWVKSQVGVGSTFTFTLPVSNGE